MYSCLIVSVGSVFCILQVLYDFHSALDHNGLRPYHVRQRAEEEGTENGKKDASIMKHIGIATSSL